MITDCITKNGKLSLLKTSSVLKLQVVDIVKKTVTLRLIQENKETLIVTLKMDENVDIIVNTEYRSD